MFNGTLTLLTKVRPEAVESLGQFLQGIDRHIQAGEPHPFDELHLEQLDVHGVHAELRKRLGASLSKLSVPEWEQRLAAAHLQAARTTLAYNLPSLILKLLSLIASWFHKEGVTESSAKVSDRVRVEIAAQQYPVQNSMILFSSVPEDRLGRLKQRFFLWLVNWRLQRNVVGLNDIRTIHCARCDGYPEGQPGRAVHVLLMLYACEQLGLEALLSRHRERLTAGGLRELHGNSPL